MKVKVGDKWSSAGGSIPIMIQLTEQDKKNIIGMLPGCDCYAIYPSKLMSREEATSWMTDGYKIEVTKENVEPDEDDKGVVFNKEIEGGRRYTLVWNGTMWEGMDTSCGLTFPLPAAAFYKGPLDEAGPQSIIDLLNIVDERAGATWILKALSPFADFADPRRKVPGDMCITQGSPMAKRQLTMEDCYRALDVFEIYAPKKKEERGG